VAQPIGDVLDGPFVAPAQREEAIGELTVGDLVARTDVVDLAGDTAPQREVDAGAVVLDEAPVTHVQPVAVQRHLAPVEQVGDEQWDDLFGKLVGTEVVGRARDDHGQSVGLEIRQRDEIGGGLRCRIRRAGAEHIALAERADVDRAVDLVGGDVQEPFDAGAPRDVAQDVGSATVGADERVGVDDRTIDVTLGGEVHDRIVTFHRIADGGAVADVTLDERKPWIVLEIAQTREVAGVGQCVVDGDMVVTVGEHVARIVGSDEPGGAGDEQSHQVPFTCAGSSAVATAERYRRGEGWRGLGWTTRGR
jgi:hypothetical protein